MKKTQTPAKKAAAPTEARRAPIHDEISAHARGLWEDYGRPVGRDEEIWFEAERQLRGAGPKARAMLA